MWRTIDTAPRDGTAVLLHDNEAPGLPGGKTTECAGFDTAVAAWWSEEGQEGEWVVYLDLVEEPRLHFSPTHWMPLPPAPTEEG